MADVAEIAKWPTSEEEVTVDGVLRVLGAETQRIWLEKWETIKRKDDEGRRLYLAQVHATIGAIGLMGCLRALREANPEAALAYAKQYWQMCDDGEIFGELLWQWTEDAGLDPNLIKLSDGPPQDAGPYDTDLNEDK